MNEPEPDCVEEDGHAWRLVRREHLEQAELSGELLRLVRNSGGSAVLRVEACVRPGCRAKRQLFE